MVYKRYLKKGKKREGPYYYHNVKNSQGKVKSIYLGTKKPSPLGFTHILIILIFFSMIIAGILFLSRMEVSYQPEEKKLSINTDQELIKVLLKQGEFISKEILIMNTGEGVSNVNIYTEGLGNLVYIKDNSFQLGSGQTKNFIIDILTNNQEKRVSYSPEVYVGNLIIKTENDFKKVPIIIEIESKEVLFDMNIYVDAQDRIINLGSSNNVEINLFNLGRIKPAKVLMEYEIKSLNGETIFTETESIVVMSQVSFYKTIQIPDNLNPGQYVFISKAKYGTSVGTSSYIFDVRAPEINKPKLYYENISNFLAVCSNSPTCWVTLLALILFVFILGSYTYFFIGAFIYSRINKNFLFKPTHDFKLERMHEAHPIKHHKAWPFLLIAILLSLATTGILYYEQLFPKILLYISQLRVSEYMGTPSIGFYFNLVLGGLLIFLIALVILRQFLKKGSYN